MQNLYYSMAGFIAVVMLVILNFDLLIPNKTKDRNKSNPDLRFRWFLYSMLVFYVIDALWGVIKIFNNVSLLCADTFIYYLSMSASVCLWCVYTGAYLRLRRKSVHLLNGIGLVLFLTEIILLVVNQFVHIFFWYDENGVYSGYIVRYALFGVQTLFFLVTGFMGMFATVQANSKLKRRYLAFTVYSMLMLATTLLQTFFPLLPVYSMGSAFGLALLHVFVHEDEKDDIRRRLQERNDIIENAGYGIWRIRLREDGHNTMYANEKLKQILGITDLSMDTEDLYRYYHSRLQENVTEIERDDYKAMMNGEVRSRLLRWKHPVKGIIYLRAGGTALILENGDQVISGYCGDITEQKLTEDKLSASLEDALKQAESANRAKTSFLFNMSHDIRTPMNAIIGFTELMEKHADDPEKCKDYRRKILGSSKFLLSLINNVLEMARIESGKMSLDENECDIPSLISQIQSTFEEQMKEKEIEFTVESSITHPYVMGDSVKQREIYLNLISNAYKYTNAGGKVMVNVRELPMDKEGFCQIETTVKDTGIGMSEEFLPKLYEEFSREKTYTDNKVEGTGLGMPIVKKFVDLMGGTITVESELGKGTTFVVTIPHRILEHKTESEEKPKISDYSVLMGKRILLAEDNDLNAEIATEILEEYGFLVERASDGVICIDMLQKEAAGHYDVILMDIQMPNMDGYKACQVIRSMNDPYRSIIPIIAMTANAFEEDKKKALEVGMNAHLPKPIQIQSLLETLYDVLIH